MEKNLTVSRIFNKENLVLIADVGKYICIFISIGYIANKLIEKDYNFKIDISKNPTIQIYK
jgi:hypothetical protein